MCLEPNGSNNEFYQTISSFLALLTLEKAVDDGIQHILEKLFGVKATLKYFFLFFLSGISSNCGAME